MGRIVAREKLFQLVFEKCFHDESEFLYDEILEDGSIDDENKEWLSTLYGGIIEYKNDIVTGLQKYVEGYKIEDLFKVDFAILVMAYYELVYYKETPAQIVANESVELAKKFSTDKSARFVNGVVAKIIKDIE